MDDLYPTAGVRILLELKEADAAGARYGAAVFTPQTRFDYRLNVALPDGAVTFVEPPSGAAAAFVELVNGMTRMIVRDALASAPLSWPRRLLRWRDK